VNRLFWWGGLYGGRSGILGVMWEEGGVGWGGLRRWSNILFMEVGVRHFNTGGTITDLREVYLGWRDQGFVSRI